VLGSLSLIRASTAQKHRFFLSRFLYALFYKVLFGDELLAIRYHFPYSAINCSHVLILLRPRRVGFLLQGFVGCAMLLDFDAPCFLRVGRGGGGLR
jgi:hypothetical protein